MGCAEADTMSMTETATFEDVSRRIAHYEGIFNIPSEATLTRQTIKVSDLPATNDTFRHRPGKGDAYMPQLVSDLAAGVRIPPLVLFLDEGAYHIDDGHHRTWAARQAGVEVLDAWVFDAAAYLPSDAHRRACASVASFMGKKSVETCRWCRQHAEAIERGDEIPEHPRDAKERELLERIRGSRPAS